MAKSMLFIVIFSGHLWPFLGLLRTGFSLIGLFGCFFSGGFSLFGATEYDFGDGFDLFWMFWDLSLESRGGFCWILMGKQAKAMKCPREIDGLEDKGPLPKAKSKSLKLASHAMKKAKVPPR